MDYVRLTYRSLAQLVECPYCGALPGASCRHGSEQLELAPKTGRESFHVERHQAAVLLGFPTVKRVALAPVRPPAPKRWRRERLASAIAPELPRELQCNSAPE